MGTAGQGECVQPTWFEGLCVWVIDNSGCVWEGKTFERGVLFIAGCG